MDTKFIRVNKIAKQYNFNIQHLVKFAEHNIEKYCIVVGKAYPNHIGGNMQVGLIESFVKDFKDNHV